MKKLFSELTMEEPFTLMWPLRPSKVVLAKNLLEGESRVIRSRQLNHEFMLKRVDEEVVEDLDH